jgi:cysteinyl-tRNA synthetase
MAVAWEVARSADLPEPDRRDLLLTFDEILALDLGTAVPAEELAGSDPHIDALVESREEARSRKDWAEADRIREALAAEGVVIEDAPGGPRWRRG